MVHMKVFIRNGPFYGHEYIIWSMIVQVITIFLENSEPDLL